MIEKFYYKDVMVADSIEKAQMFANAHSEVPREADEFESIRYRRKLSDFHTAEIYLSLNFLLYSNTDDIRAYLDAGARYCIEKRDGVIETV